MGIIGRGRKKAVIFDLDGTIADIEHRRHHLEGDKPRWDKFFADCGDDTLNTWARELNKAMRMRGYKTIILSGRSDEVREITEDWLKSNKFDYDSLIMRKEGDYTPDDKLKSIFYSIFIKDYFDVIFVVDDRQKVVDLWRGLGLTCLQCDEGQF